MSEGIRYASGIFGLVTDDAINFDTDKIVSFSQYSKYKKCPKSWELHYVRKQKIPSQSIAFVYGTAMHEVIQSFLHVCYTKSIKKAAELDLNGMLMDVLKREYKTAVEKNGEHFSSREQLIEYYSDGVEILKYLKSKRAKYFSTKGVKLVGIELPLTVQPDPSRPNIKLQQHLDLVFYDSSVKRYLILDIKTAKNGWNQYKKKDKNTTNQLILYKKWFCGKFDIDTDKVDVKYFILRQKIDPDSLWPIKRISEFSPASGKIAISQLTKDFQKFLDDCFDANGEYIDKSHPAFAGKNKWNCTYCDYNERLDLCPLSNRIEHV